MSSKNLFKSILISKSKYDSTMEIPCIETDYIIPNKLIPFSKALKTKDFNQWVHFYEYDDKFERIWNNPLKYISILKKFNGVITPDFSLYRDMPLVMQFWNIFRGRAVGVWLQKNGIRTLPNVRWADKRTYELSYSGLQQSGTICIGSHGCLKRKEDKSFFIDGFDFVIKKLKPKNVIIYGKVSNEMIVVCKKENVNIIQFKSEFECTRKEVL